MKKVSVAVVLVVLTTLLAACSFVPETPPKPSQAQAAHPNVVFILADDMKADDLRFMPKTRALLGAKGTTFENAFVTHSMCCPSRSSILRGQYSHNHKVYRNAWSDGGEDRFRRVGDEQSTIGTWLQGQGYRTAMLGKYLHPGPETPKDFVPTGWDEFLRVGGYFDYEVNDNGTVAEYGHAPEDYSTDLLARRSIDFVRRSANEGKPFLLYLAPKAPHLPYTPAPRHEDTYPGLKVPRSASFFEKDVADKPAWMRTLTPYSGAEAARMDGIYRARAQTLLSLDDAIEGLMNTLEETGQLSNSYVVLTSDNGYLMGEHRVKEGKGVPYEESIKVPMVVRGPGVLEGRKEGRFALNIDLAPTFAEIAGATAPDFVDGRSLMPLLKGESVRWRNAFLVEYWAAPKGKLPTFSALRAPRHLYAEYASGDKELYDLVADPLQLQSRHASANPDGLKTLKARLDALKGCAGETCRTAEDGVLPAP